MRIAPLLAFAACSDYQLGTKPDREPPPPPDHSGAPPETTPPAPAHSAAPFDSVPPSCADVPLPTLAWEASPPFAEPADPLDGAGIPFHDPAAQPQGWTPVALPDRGVPVGFDRAYRASFSLSDLPVDLSLDLQSDDGLAVWVNGVEVGRWGGGWQEEGCVNDRAQCLVTTAVPPVSITPHLVAGDNLIAARVSNPVQNAYFSIAPLCVEP